MMIAVILSNAYYAGFKPLDYEGEEETFQCDFLLFEELPPILEQIPSGFVAKYDRTAEEFVLEAIPPEPTPEPTPEQLRIEQLETQNIELMLAIAEMAEADAQEKTEMQIAIAELAEMITGGV